jgi:N6-adenosine-specific RNA methylase IME4
MANSQTLLKQERRARLEAELGARILALPVKRYGVIYADPPWRFQAYSRATGEDRNASNHYATSTLEEIKAIDAGSLAAKDSVLFLWAITPMLPQALEVMARWGFEYKSHFIWAKDRVGLGFWNRGKHELLLIGTRGKIPAPAPGTQFHSLLEAPVSRHSEKPALFRKVIERYYPTLPRLELFARGEAPPAWDVWGAEVLPPGGSP